MLRRPPLAATLVLGLALLSAADGFHSPKPAGKMRGVCWEGAGRIDASRLEPLGELGASWISQTPFGWVRSAEATEIRYGGSHVLWGESDEGLVATAAWARERGIRTLLKPHLWVHRAGWPGDIDMPDEQAWAAWFDSYEEFILRYARLAESHGLEALAVGTELGGTTGREREWRRVIARVREVYHGRLTYCANWNGEPERVAFWDALDFIGIQAYYPIAEGPSPSLETIRDAWSPIASRLEALARRTRRPIVFTEIGYRSQDGALERPWEWRGAGSVNLDLQRDAFAAMYDALWDRPWFGGTFIWKWHPVPPEETGGNCDFTPQGKPALGAIRAAYRASPGEPGSDADGRVAARGSR